MILKRLNQQFYMPLFTYSFETPSTLRRVLQTQLVVNNFKSFILDDSTEIPLSMFWSLQRNSLFIDVLLMFQIPLILSIKIF